MNIRNQAKLLALPLALAACEDETIARVLRRTTSGGTTTWS